MKWIIYGSYGYTGNLIAEKLAKLNRDVILSGRDDVKLKKQSTRLGLSARTADLNRPEQLDELLKDAGLVIHCAGPFRYTWEKMARACLRNNCHYLDITGEVEVFEGMNKLDHHFKNANLMALPGAGFDVVPSDCLAKFLSNRLPDATELEIAFMGLGGGASRGTLKTMVENLGEGGLVRRDGKLKKVPTAYKMKEFNFGDRGKKKCVSIPWGDLSTASKSTSIPDITVYMAMPNKMIRAMKISNRISFLLKQKPVRFLLKKYIDTLPAGPSDKEREIGKSYFFGCVSNENGAMKKARLVTPEGYKLTTETSVIIASMINNGNFIPGYQTPSTAYGPDLILKVKNTHRTVL